MKSALLLFFLSFSVFSQQQALGPDFPGPTTPVLIVGSKLVITGTVIEFRYQAVSENEPGQSYFKVRIQGQEPDLIMIIDAKDAASASIVQTAITSNSILRMAGEKALRRLQSGALRNVYVMNSAEVLLY